MARALLLFASMRTVVVLTLMALLGCVFLAQKQRDNQKAVTPPEVTTQKASPRPVSEHNWAKHALDETNKVTRQIVEQRKTDGTR